MASVFLSYAREDAARASAIATALERAGHSVWWDKHIETGAEYSLQISSALKEAAAVVVLWSRTSVESPWVRDEAAAGRDSGRLIPVLIDDTDPPLGFRQYQAIDLSRWSGRGEPEAFKTLKGAVAAKVAQKAGGCEEHPPSSATKRPILSLGPATFALAALAALALIFGIWRYTGPSSAEPAKLALAVMPFSDMSAGRDQAYFGEGVAEEIMNLVSRDEGLTLIGRTSAWQLKDDAADLDTIRSKLGATHLLEGSVRVAGEAVRVTARLIDTTSGEQLWVEDYERPLADIFAVQEDIGASVAERLRGTVAAIRDSRQAKAIRTQPEVYKLYLSAKAVVRRRDYESQVKAEQLLQTALDLDPKYAPAHALMAITLEFMDGFRPGGMFLNRPQDQARALSHARRAMSLAPDLAEAHVALGLVLFEEDQEASLQALRKAIALDPHNYFAWNNSGVLLQVAQCRYSEAAESYRRAAAIEPLLPGPNNNLVNVYLEMGKVSEAEEVLTRYIAVAGDPRQAHWARGHFHFWTGNMVESLHSWRAAMKLGVGGPQTQQYVAGALYKLGRIDDAVEAFPSEYRSMYGNYWRKDFASASAEAATLGERLWGSIFLGPPGVKAMVHAGQGDRTLELFDRRWGSARGFIQNGGCTLHQFGPSLVVAMRQAGRHEEASQILSAAIAEHRRRIRNGFAAPEIHANAAALLVLVDRKDEALRHLEMAVEKGWMDQADPMYVSLNDPVFTPVRDHPRFRAVSQSIARKLAAQASTLRL